MRHLKSTTAIILAAIGIANAPAAQASPEADFLDGLTDHGITVTDASTAVNWGWAICSALNSNTGDVVAENFYRITDYSVPDRYTAATWVVEAVVHLCPWQYHGTTATSYTPDPEPSTVPITGGLGGRIG